MMRRCRFQECIVLLAACVLLICLFQIHYGPGHSNDVDDEPMTNSNVLKEDIREMCQFLEHEVTGEEGDAWVKGNEYDKKLKLRSLHVVFRHGERSPMKTEFDPVGCLPTREIDRKSFAAYKSMAMSDDVKEFLKNEKELDVFPRVPDDSKCESGMLTAEGALQHVRLGQFFRQKYKNSALILGENQRVNLEITTSKYNRTFQSVLAFSSEFLYKLRPFVPPVTIKSAYEIYQCTDEFCRCDAARSMRRMYEEEHVAEFEKMLKVDAEKKQKVDDVLETFEALRPLSDPLQFVDVALGKYVCRRKTLPCVGEKCLNFEFFNEMINISTSRGARMFDSSKGIARRLQVVESYTMLAYLHQTLDNMRRFPHSNYIRIFSAHDVIVSSMLRTLGIAFVDPAHYTSRIVFEVYEHTDLGMFVRVLYNGRNRSHDVRFCKGENLQFGMCRAAVFEEFVKKGIFDLIGVTSYKEACRID